MQASLRKSFGLAKGFTLVDILPRSRPVPYDCVITARFPEVASTVAAEELQWFENYE
jgi:hypothetical protein